MPMGLPSTSTQSMPVIGGGLQAIETSRDGETISRFKLSGFLRNTASSGAAIGITTIRCISNTARSFSALNRSLVLAGRVTVFYIGSRQNDRPDIEQTIP